MESPGGTADEVVTVPDVVVDDADAEHAVPDRQGVDVHDPMTVPERFGMLWGSSWKLLPEPLKLFDCLAWIFHW
jgi:hypothetical protein